MLRELYIRNLAVISEAVIPFSGSFNVFTGETGAGKSILINGINAVLGQRITKDIVRAGCDKAVITALFTDLSDKVKARLDELGIAYDDDQISVTREISSDGGSVARVNSRSTSVSVLREIGEVLVNIHGQHDNQILMQPERHIGILDSFAGLEETIEDYHKSFTELQEVSRRLRSLASKEKSISEKAETIRMQIEEIGSAKPYENEDEILEADYKRSTEGVDIKKALSKSGFIIDGDDEQTGIYGMLDDISNTIGDYSDMIPEIAKLMPRIESLQAEIEDISSELSVINDRIDIDPAHIAEVSDRLEVLRSLKRKYGPSLSDVISCYENACSESTDSESLTEQIEEAAKEKNRLLSEVSEKAKKLSELRKASAQRFSEMLEEELSFLDMPNVRLMADIRQGKLTGNGMDSVEFMISTNKGEEMKPLSKIASGGELSRIMLALKNVIADKDDVGTLIFDEIDTGVSGRAAQKIGIKLSQAAESRQVLCVTHLAQMAVMADNHLLIEKKTENDRTFTSVRKLENEERKYEIARIMCGNDITDTALKNAEELLESYSKRKEA